MARFICVESTIADLHTVGKKYQKMIDWWIRVIEAQPVVDVAQVRHGRWIRLDKDNMFFVPHMLKCSVCGNTLDKHGVNAGRGDANYCPHCGAKMDGGDGE